MVADAGQENAKHNGRFGLYRAAPKFASDAAVRQEVRLELQLVERGLHIPTRD